MWEPVERMISTPFEPFIIQEKTTPRQQTCKDKGGTYGTVSLKPPFLPRVIGVRTASIMTTSSGDLTPILVASAAAAVVAAVDCLARWEAICVRRAAMVVVEAVVGCCC